MTVFQTQIGPVDLKDFDKIEIRTYKGGKAWTTETFTKDVTLRQFHPEVSIPPSEDKWER